LDFGVNCRLQGLVEIEEFYRQAPVRLSIRPEAAPLPLLTDDASVNFDLTCSPSRVPGIHPDCPDYRNNDVPSNEFFKSIGFYAMGSALHALRSIFCQNSN